MPRCAAFRNAKLQNIEMFGGESALHKTADSALARQGRTALTGMGPASRVCIKIRRRSRKVPPELARLFPSSFGLLFVEGVKDRKRRAWVFTSHPIFHFKDLPRNDDDVATINKNCGANQN